MIVFQLISIVMGFVLVGFWFWMFLDLTNNQYLSPQEKNNWFLAFILLNVFAAGYYYLVEYRNRRL